jgi:hypothetical protein
MELPPVCGILNVNSDVCIDKGPHKGHYERAIHAEFVFKTVFEYNDFAKEWNCRIGKEMGKELPIYPK